MSWCIAMSIASFILGVWVSAKVVTYLCNQHVESLYHQQGYRMGSFENGGKNHDRT